MLLTCSPWSTWSLSALISRIAPLVRVSQGGCREGYTDHPTKDTLLNLHRRRANDEPPNACGADDTQNPALTKLPPLLAAHYQDSDLMTRVVSAVRVTNNNDTAVAYAKAAALMLQGAITGSSPTERVQRAKSADANVAAAIEKAESMVQDSVTVAAEVGVHCGLDASFVVICHLLLNAESYQQAVRDNILCGGGDNCGRAVTPGAILAACFYDKAGALPSLWVSRTRFLASRWWLPSALGKH